jgi:hypothetical protein
MEKSYVLEKYDVDVLNKQGNILIKCTNKSTSHVFECIALKPIDKILTFLDKCFTKTQHYTYRFVHKDSKLILILKANLDELLNLTEELHFEKKELTVELLKKEFNIKYLSLEKEVENICEKISNREFQLEDDFSKCLSELIQENKELKKNIQEIQSNLNKVELIFDTKLTKLTEVLFQYEIESQKDHKILHDEIESLNKLIIGYHNISKEPIIINRTVKSIDVSEIDNNTCLDKLRQLQFLEIVKVRWDLLNYLQGIKLKEVHIINSNNLINYYILLTIKCEKLYLHYPENSPFNDILSAPLCKFLLEHSNKLSFKYIEIIQGNKDYETLLNMETLTNICHSKGIEIVFN